jgi:hypothetical protein
VIAKVPKGRADGRSSFASIVAYIAKSASALVFGEALWSVETAAREMQHVASANRRCAQPVYHYLVSWPQSERPSDDQAFDMVRTSLADLGLLDHQWVGAVHRNTAHTHVHVVVNRVHPTTLRAASPRRDWLILDRACRNAELKHGWSHDRGPHIVVGSDGMAAVSRRERERSDTAIPQSARARDFSAWTGLESFQTWVAGEPARQLLRAIQSAPRSWQTVHEVLRTHNLAYQPKGSGAIVVDLVSPDKFCAKASHLGRWAALARMQSILGPYEPLRTIDSTSIGRSFSPETRVSYRNRVSGPRMESVLRRYQRDPLFDRFTQDRADWQSVGLPKYRAMCLLQRRSEVERRHRLQISARLARDRIRQTQTPRLRRLVYSQVAWRAAIARQELRFDIQQERVDLRAVREHTAPEGWTQWLRTQASAGDEQAKRRLRRLAMRERRRDEFGPLQELGSIHSNESPRRVTFGQYRVIVRATSLHYCIRGRLVFCDEGRRLALYSEDHDQIRASLLLAREKWGREISVVGSGSFRRLAAHLATDLGMSVLDRGALGNNYVDAQTVSDESTAARRSKTWIDELRRLSREVAKPVCIPRLRSGDRYTGKVVAIISVTHDETMIVLDIGREIGAFPWNQPAADCQELLSKYSIVTAHAVSRDTVHPIWRFQRKEQSRHPPDIGLR